MLDWRTKGLPPCAEGLNAEELGALGLSLFAGDLMMPAAVVRERALHANIAEMQAFAERVGALLCPHGKTSMSPELFRLQLAAGAWGITAATPHYVRVYRRFGIARIFLANQLVGRSDIAFVLGELKADPGFDFYCLADSVEGVELLARCAVEAGLERPIQLLVETGFGGGRAGARTVGAALAVARRIAAEPSLSLRGVETFEGIRQTRADARREVREMLALSVQVAEAASAEGLFGDGPLFLSAGGSAFLDLCVGALPERIGRHRIERILRPGCYVTHDSGLYVRLSAEAEATAGGMPRLRHALEVWGMVQSVPEPELAIVGVGKRDASFDIEPPIPLWVHSPEQGLRQAEGVAVDGLWDQHLSLRTAPGALRFGDMVGFGVSHPCATFDRWRALMTVDDGYRVTGAVTTCF